MTVFELFVEKCGMNESKAIEVYSGENKTPIEEADVNKKAKLTCPACKKGVKIKPAEFVMGCPKCSFVINA